MSHGSDFKSPSGSGSSCRRLRSACGRRLLDVDCADDRDVYRAGDKLGAVLRSDVHIAGHGGYSVWAFIVGTGMSDYNMGFWTMVVIAPVVGAVLAFLIGIATLRLSGVYFVIFTLGLEMIHALVSWIQNNFTGSRGLYVLTDLTEADIYIYLVILAAVVYLAGWWVNRSRLGFALRIIGNDETVARHVGINTATSKVILFTFSGFVAALVGALIAALHLSSRTACSRRRYRSLSSSWRFLAAPGVCGVRSSG